MPTNLNWDVPRLSHVSLPAPSASWSNTWQRSIKVSSITSAPADCSTPAQDHTIYGVIADTLPSWTPFSVTLVGVFGEMTSYEAPGTVLTVGAFLLGLDSTSYAPASRVTITSTKESQNLSSRTTITSTVTATEWYPDIPNSTYTRTQTEFIAMTMTRTFTTSTASPVATSWIPLSGSITTGPTTGYFEPTVTIKIPQDYNTPAVFDLLQPYPHELMSAIGLTVRNISSFSVNANGTHLSYGPWGGYHMGPVTNLDCELSPESDTGACRYWSEYSGKVTQDFTYRGKRVPFYLVGNDATMQRGVHEMVRMSLLGVLVFGVVLLLPLY